MITQKRQQSNTSIQHQQHVQTTDNENQHHEYQAICTLQTETSLQ